jgi:hypothetical protein
LPSQLVANLVLVVLMKGFFGKSKFFHSLFALITMSFNFNLMPMLYIMMADDGLKRAVSEQGSI